MNGSRCRQVIAMSLSDFYRSSKWQNLVATLKLERVNDKGELICEHCGKPIVKAYDCIAHHKVYLNENNVDDVTVSLNPENIMLVHHRCHNEIHERFGFDRQHIYVVYGSPLSGKSTFVKERMRNGDLIVDIDRIWDCVSACGYEKPNKLKSVVFGLRDELMDMVKTRRGKWTTAYIIGGFPLISDRERLQKTLGAELIFIDTPKEECLARLEDVTDNRDKDKWKTYIEEWWCLYR